MAPIQKGTLGELAVANVLLIESGGLLRCARPHADDHGQDWRMYAPESAASVGLQVKTAFAVERGYELSYLIDLDQLPRDRRHVVVVCTVGAAGPPGIEDDAWWIPADAMPRDRGGIYLFKTSLRPRSDNQWERYRIGRAGLAEAAWATSASVGGPPAPSPRPEWGSGLSPLAQGRVHEDHLTHLLFVQSGGAMCAFRPVADSIGLDMLVRTAEEDHALGVQVKGAFVDDERSKVHVHVNEATFRPDADRFLVALGFIPRDLRPVPCVWVIRMDEVERLAEPHGGYYQLALDRVGGDAFAPWRFPLAQAIRPFEAALGVLNREGRGAALPSGRREVGRVLRAGR